MINRIIASIFIVATLSGCESEMGIERDFITVDRVCADTVSEVIGEFTLHCIDNANPKSDEEPEDWIDMCHEMAVDIYCPLKKRIDRKVCTNTGADGSCHWYYSPIIDVKWSDISGGDE